MDNKSIKLRKSIRLADFDYSWAGYYFVTVVSHQHKSIFGEIKNDIVHLNRLGKIVEECWKEVPLHIPYVEVDVHVIMPNHFHGIILIKDFIGAQHAEPQPNNKDVQRQPLGVIVRSFKSAVTKRVHDLGLFVHEKIWQRNFYDHIIRDEVDYQKISEYI